MIFSVRVSQANSYLRLALNKTLEDRGRLRSILITRKVSTKGTVRGNRRRKGSDTTLETNTDS